MTTESHLVGAQTSHSITKRYYQETRNDHVSRLFLRRRQHNLMHLHNIDRCHRGEGIERSIMFLLAMTNELVVRRLYRICGHLHVLI